MSAGTTIVLTLGPALITGLVSFAVARTQVGVAQAQVAAERDRLWIEYGEAARQQRLADYQALLMLMYRLDVTVNGFGSEPFGDRVFTRWIDDFLRLCSGIDLSCRAQVRDALDGVRAVVDAIGIAAAAAGGSFAQSFSAAYGSRRAELDAKLEALQSAMQADVELGGVA